MADVYEDLISGVPVVLPINERIDIPALVIGGSTTAPTMGTNTRAYTAIQNVESLEMALTYSQTGAGVAGSGTYLFPLPPGKTVSILEVPVSHYNAAGLAVVGACELYDGTKIYEGTVHVYNATNLYCRVGNEVTTPQDVGSSTFSLLGATFRLSFKAKFLCTEFVGNGYRSYGSGKATAQTPGLTPPRGDWVNINAQVTGTGWTSGRCRARYYEENDGTKKINFHIYGTATSTLRTSYLLVISGVTFIGNTQALSGVTSNSGLATASYTGSSSGSVGIEHASATTSAYAVFGDVEVIAKPSWA